MATILAVGNSENERRCDGRCHAASEPRCACICEGRYHGIGSSQAAAEQLQQDMESGALGEDLRRIVTATQQRMEGTS